MKKKNLLPLEEMPEAVLRPEHSMSPTFTPVKEEHSENNLPKYPWMTAFLRQDRSGEQNTLGPMTRLAITE